VGWQERPSPPRATLQSPTDKAKVRDGGWPGCEMEGRGDEGGGVWDPHRSSNLPALPNLADTLSLQDLTYPVVSGVGEGGALTT
jgi:hypothetical protein